ncbi:late embryogenesis abundant protein At1g64065-like [Rosa rugosa]|uniref:late embryogenesis abundant protein At1g64065-like n=1 Tax=Rosa rugosa TaxID=74645 RepID=UPI002B40A121|nr:late embryogenesis abundant protein At1g64065-like [Rosa rugosa]
MAEKSDHEMTYPLTPFDGYERIDGESFVSRDELQRKKRMKLFIYIAIFVAFQTIVITVLALTVMQAHVPRALLNKIDVQTLNYNPATPSFNMSFTTEIWIKNINWGPFKFGSGIVQFFYHDTKNSKIIVPIGEAVIPSGKVKMRSTKKINVEVRLNSDALQSHSSDLRSELNRGVIYLRSGVQLHGHLYLMYILKKSKYAVMDCEPDFDLSTKTVTIAHMHID